MASVSSMVSRLMPYSQFQSPPVSARVPATSMAQGTVGKVLATVPVFVFHMSELPIVLVFAVTGARDSPNSALDSVPMR